ncbi:MAG: DUF805 domain-containing protein [Porphyromonas sp.]|nr:DUF805 domain-containing protein [Porphyromonas sp.]
MKWFLKVLRQYADFSGRARRKEYWYFTLFDFIFAFVAGALDNILGLNLPATMGTPIPYGYIYLLYGLAVFIPALAVTVRRLHDIGKSGWWVLIALIPLVGAIWLLYYLVLDSVPGANRWGENPKEVEIIA